ncbi:hypothetical protein [Fructilactobacillus florum]|nr:hypothetical protein [Fructilactobacillus florum]
MTDSQLKLLKKAETDYRRKNYSAAVVGFSQLYNELEVVPDPVVVGLTSSLLAVKRPNEAAQIVDDHFSFF